MVLYYANCEKTNWSAILENNRDNKDDFGTFKYQFPILEIFFQVNIFNLCEQILTYLNTYAIKFVL